MVEMSGLGPRAYPQPPESPGGRHFVTVPPRGWRDCPWGRGPGGGGASTRSHPPSALHCWPQIQADTNLLEEENKIFNSYLKNVANQQHSQLRVAGGDPTGPSSDEQDMVSEISDGSVGTSNTASTAMTGKKSKGTWRGGPLGRPGPHTLVPL